VLVAEMGMRGLGQVEALCAIARPDVAVVTSIGPEHLGGFLGRESAKVAELDKPALPLIEVKPHEYNSYTISSDGRQTLEFVSPADLRSNLHLAVFHRGERVRLIPIFILFHFLVLPFLIHNRARGVA
jgi:hypothetical protein